MSLCALCLSASSALIFSFVPFVSFVVKLFSCSIITSTVTYHPGEVAVQKRVGVREQAEELTGMYRDALTPPVAAFLAQHRFAVLSSQDADGNVWASPLAGPAG